MWHVGVPKAWLVASICFSKSLSGSFTHVTACMCLKREGKRILCLPGPPRALQPHCRGTEGLLELQARKCILPAHPTLQFWEQRPAENVSARLSEILKPPSSASLRTTASAFKPRKCQVLPCHTSCPAFAKTELLFWGLGKADLATEPSPAQRGCSKPRAYLNARILSTNEVSSRFLCKI